MPQRHRKKGEQPRGVCIYCGAEGPIDLPQIAATTKHMIGAITQECPQEVEEWL